MVLSTVFFSLSAKPVVANLRDNAADSLCSQALLGIPPLVFLLPAPRAL